MTPVHGWSGRVLAHGFSALVLMCVCAGSAAAEEIPFSKLVRASLVFRGEHDATRRYPHLLKVFLRLDNAHDADVYWVANPVGGIEAELLDAAGKPVPPPPTVASVQSSVSAFFLPYGSRLDWLVSHGGVSMVGDVENSYALVVGDHGWLVPIRAAGDYALHVRLRGLPWSRHAVLRDTPAPRLLLDLAPAKLEVTP